MSGGDVVIVNSPTGVQRLSCSLRFSGSLFFCVIKSKQLHKSLSLVSKGLRQPPGGPEITRAALAGGYQQFNPRIPSARRLYFLPFHCFPFICFPCTLSFVSFSFPLPPPFPSRLFSFLFPCLLSLPLFIPGPHCLAST